MDKDIDNLVETLDAQLVQIIEQEMIKVMSDSHQNHHCPDFADLLQSFTQEIVAMIAGDESFLEIFRVRVGATLWIGRERTSSEYIRMGRVRGTSSNGMRAAGAL